MLALIVCFAAAAHAQRLAVLAPTQDDISNRVGERLSDAMIAANGELVDGGLASAAFRAMPVSEPFNQTVAQAKDTGNAIGCDAAVLVRAGKLRRAMLDAVDKYEAFTAVYVVSSRTGRLVYWKLVTKEAPSAELAERELLAAIASVADEIIEKSRLALHAEHSERPRPLISEMSSDASKLPAGLRPPVPYRRIKPEYTRTAYLYDVAATVDVEVDLDERGAVTRAEIVRWAGFGLDESVLKTVGEMNWRPAMRGDKALPMRVLLRYNFRKLEKEKDETR
jgi:hypothetical protein